MKSIWGLSVYKKSALIYDEKSKYHLWDIQLKDRDGNVSIILTNGCHVEEYPLNVYLSGDISKWNTSKVTNMSYMFAESKFNSDISEWNTSMVQNIDSMFNSSKFNGNIDYWGVSSITYKRKVIYNSPLESNPPKWLI